MGNNNAKTSKFRTINKKISAYSVMAIIILFFIIIIVSSLGSAKVPVFQTYKLILNGIPLIRNLVDISDINANFKIIIQDVRLPRVFLAVLVGMALSASGVMYQGLFRNPMADPYIIGISSGASLAATISIIAGFSTGIAGVSAIIVSAFTGALIVSFIVFNISRGKGGYISVLTLILSGIAIGSLCSAGTSFLMMIGSEDLHRVIFWIMGSLTTSQWIHVKIVGPVIIIGCIVLFLYTKDLNIITLGEKRAKQLGINAELMKNMVIIITSFVVASAVSVSGIIGFIGLVVPHMMRIMVGPDNRVLLPISALSGGILLLLADTLARTIMSPREIPVGIITALLGSPFFIYLLRKTKNRIVV